MLVKTARTILILFIIFVMSVFIPEYYWKIFEKNIRAPFVLYSPIIHDFIITRFDNKEVKRIDNEGHELTRDEFEELEPFFFYRQIAMDGKMPDSINGMEIDLQELRKNNFTYRIKPSDINEPYIQLYPLLESQSGRASLEMPEEFIRLQSECEFINCETNETVDELTEKFTYVFRTLDFRFPAVKVFGNPTTRKPFDEGYFIVDSRGDLFHLKRVKDNPLLTKILKPEGVEIEHIIVTENDRREFYGIVISKTSEIFLISYDQHKFIETPIKEYNKEEHELMIRGNIQYRLFTITSDDMIKVVVTDRDYKKINEYEESWINREKTSAGNFANVVFPFTLSIVDGKEPFLNFYFFFSDTRAVIGIIISLIIATLFFIRRKSKIKNIWQDFVIIALTGIFGLLAILLIRNEE
jgi:hypothetical protein